MRRGGLSSRFEFYRHHLCFAGNGTSDPNVRQRFFCRLLEEHTELDDSLGREEMKLLYKEAESEDEALSRSLQRIGHLEALIAGRKVA